MKAKPGKEAALEEGIKSSWLKAMAEQPGFVSAALLQPFADEDMEKGGGVKPEHTLEVLSLWRSEEDRLAWVARPIHDQVFLPLLDLTESVSPTLQNVTHSRNL